jgi:hypothetical protein
VQDAFLTLQKLDRAGDRQEALMFIVSAKGTVF